MEILELFVAFFETLGSFGGSSKKDRERARKMRAKVKAKNKAKRRKQ